MTTPPETPDTPIDTVEALVRRQLGEALGGRRGVVEAAVPTLTFTVVWLLTRHLQVALGASVGVALVELTARVVQRQTVKFCVNALVGIALGWFFVHLAASRGGSADDQALAYFVPGLLYNAGYAVVIALTCLTGWPLVGFMIGSVTGDPTAWHADRQVVRLCSRLTWLLVLPCAVRAAGAGPDLVRRPLRQHPRRHGGRRARRAEDRHGLAAAARRAGRDVVAARAQPHARSRPVDRSGLRVVGVEQRLQLVLHVGGRRRTAARRRPRWAARRRAGRPGRRAGSSPGRRSRGTG